MWCLKQLLLVLLLLLLLLLLFTNGIFWQNMGKTCTTMNIFIYSQKQEDKNDNNGNKRHDAVEKLNFCINPLTLLG